MRHLKQGLATLSRKQDWNNQPEPSELAYIWFFEPLPTIIIMMIGIIQIPDLHHVDTGDIPRGGLLLASALCGSPPIPFPNIRKVSCINTGGWDPE